MGRRENSPRHYYEFVAIDRQLTSDQIAIMRMLLGRASIYTDRMICDVTRRSDPELNFDALLTAFFDMAVMLHMDGRRYMAFRLPRDLERGIKPYVNHNSLHGVETWVAGEHLFVKFQRHDEDTLYGTVQPETWIATFLPLRDMMMAGDLSPAYAAWEMGESDGIYYPEPPAVSELDGLEELGDWSPVRVALDNWLWIDDILNTERDRKAWMQIPGSGPELE